MRDWCRQGYSNPSTITREVAAVTTTGPTSHVDDLHAGVADIGQMRVVMVGAGDKHIDGGARRVGEFGIGLNAEITTLTRDLFFDEKILGTVHLALGRAYPECGGTNSSALHWDIVKDLRDRSGRPGGTLLVDGEPFDLDENLR